MKYRLRLSFNFAFALIRKLYKCGYLRIEYGELRTCGGNNGVDYPLTKKETEFLKEELEYGQDIIRED